MEGRDLLIQGWDFDRWANLRWFEYLESKGWPEPDRTIFQHILAGQEIWYQRTQGTSLMEMPQTEVSLATIDRHHAQWVELLKGAEGDPAITFRRTTGEAFVRPLSQISRHLMDHGTYHRGELRGLCRSRGEEDFPEAGLMGFYSTLV